MQSKFDKLFQASVLLKAVDAIAEIIGGLFLFFVSPGNIQHLVHRLTQKELATDPHDYIASLLVHGTKNLSPNTTTFGSIYLLTHGVIKLLVIYLVLRHKLWSYPLFILVIAGFMSYQILELTHRFSIGYTALTIFDGFIIVLAAIEWQKQRKLHEHSQDEH